MLGYSLGGEDRHQRGGRQARSGKEIVFTGHDITWRIRSPRLFDLATSVMFGLGWKEPNIFFFLLKMSVYQELLRVSIAQDLVILQDENDLKRLWSPFRVETHQW